MKRKFVSLVVCLSFVLMVAVPAALAPIASAADYTFYRLFTNATNGSITKTPEGSFGLDMYLEGTVVTLTAVPASGYQFVNWSGDASGTANPTTVLMNKSKTVTANFTIITKPPTPPPTPTTTPTWYLAEGTTAWGFSDYISIENVFVLSKPANLAKSALTPSQR